MRDYWFDTSDAISTYTDHARETIDGSQEDMASRTTRDVDRTSYDVDAHVEFYEKQASHDVDQARETIDGTREDMASRVSQDVDRSNYDVDDHARVMTEKAKGDADAAGAAADGAFYPGAGWTGDMLDKTAFDLGWGFDAAMAMLCALPDLILGLKDALAGWFDVDVEKLVTDFQGMQDKLKPRVEE